MSKADVSEAKKKIGVVYAAGCTGFVADILGEAQKHSSQWTRGAAVQKKDLKAGDVCGWGGSGSAGHVMIFGDNNKYLNCPGPNQAVKENDSMGNQQIYRMSY